MIWTADRPYCNEPPDAAGIVYEATWIAEDLPSFVEADCVAVGLL